MWIDRQIQFHAFRRFYVRVWIPKRVVIVIGSSNKLDQECFVERCLEDKILVLRRRGGGGTVVLYPGCVVVSLGCWVKQPIKYPHYFNHLNQSVIDSLVSRWTKCQDLALSGLSDISYHNRKLVGSSLFRSRRFLLYQASILVELCLPIINRYLRFPSKEPDYRQGKSHGNFLTSLQNLLQKSIPPEEIKQLLQTQIPRRIEEKLEKELEKPSKKEYEIFLRNIYKYDTFNANKISC